MSSLFSERNSYQLCLSLPHLIISVGSSDSPFTVDSVVYWDYSLQNKEVIFRYKHGSL